MKQLYFHFLFFIFFPLMLVQCAQLFPSPQRTPSVNKLAPALTRLRNYERAITNSFTSLNKSAYKKVTAGQPFFKSIAFPNTITKYFNAHLAFNKTYIHFNYESFLDEGDILHYKQ